MGLSAGCSRKRLAAFAILVPVLLLVFGFGSPRWQAARAQGEDAPTTDETAPSPQVEPNLFKHVLVSVGPIFGPLLAFVSVGLVALIVLLAMDLRMSVAIAPEFVEEFTDTVNKRKFKEAFDMAKADNSFLAKVLTAGMGRLQYGIEDAREAAFNMVETMKASKEQLITYLATIATLGPMLGLVGTVYGMIQSFMYLGVEGKTPKASDLAKGISHALVVTLIGVALSVPAIFCHAFFRNRLIRITMDTTNIADDLLTQMYHNSRKGAGAPAPAPAAPSVNAGPVAAKPVI